VAEYDDTAALQLVKYADADSNERMTVAGCYDDLWADSAIMSNAIAKLPAYLYAFERFTTNCLTRVYGELGKTMTQPIPILANVPFCAFLPL